MFAIRPIEEKDLQALKGFAFETAAGMLSLPKDTKKLEEKILLSLASFQAKVSKPSNEIYLFVLENGETKEVVGCSAIYAKTGFNEPYYCYRIETLYPRKQMEKQAERVLNPLLLREKLQLLHPYQFSNGPTELCSLFLKKEWRKEKLGALLSLSRFLFIASFPERFDEQTIARLRGVMHQDTHTAPFWEGIGKHFLSVDFQETQSLQYHGTAFIPEFLPPFPIYIPLLPQSVQEVIGMIHSTTQPAEKLLIKEGFHPLPLIDLFDGGPFLGAETKQVHAIKKSQLAVVEEIAADNGCPLEKATFCFVSNAEVSFRCCYAPIRFNSQDTIAISQKTAQLLQIQTKGAVRLLTS